MTTNEEPQTATPSHLMIHAIWILTILMLSMFAELTAARSGILLPVFLMTAFYLAVIYPPWKLLLPLGTVALVLDLSLSRNGFGTILAVGAVMYGVTTWKRHGDCTQLLLQVIPGVSLGLLWALVLILTQRLDPQFLHWRDIFTDGLLFAEATFLTALVFPLLVRLLDRIAEPMNLPEYQFSQRGKPGGL
ncbi:MAG: hypothetical protein R6V56_01130 [Lentisphaeria bacterium]